MALRKPLYFDTVDQVNKDITSTDDVELNNLTLGGILSTTGVDVNNGSVQNVAAPSADDHAANKAYVDSLVSSAEEHVKHTFTANVDMDAGDPVYLISANTVDRAVADGAADLLRRVIGLTSSAVTAGNPVDVVSLGVLPGVLSAATPGQFYWLSLGGGIQTTAPEANRIRTGYAINATDMFVQIHDYGTPVYDPAPPTGGAVFEVNFDSTQNVATSGSSLVNWTSVSGGHVLNPQGTINVNNTWDGEQTVVDPTIAGGVRGNTGTLGSIPYGPGQPINLYMEVEWTGFGGHQFMEFRSLPFGNFDQWTCWAHTAVGSQFEVKRNQFNGPTGSVGRWSWYPAVGVKYKILIVDTFTDIRLFVDGVEQARTFHGTHQAHVFEDVIFGTIRSSTGTLSTGGVQSKFRRIAYSGTVLTEQQILATALDGPANV